MMTGTDGPDQANFDYLFTPEKIAVLDNAAAKARTGNNICLEEMRQEFETKRQTWVKNDPPEHPNRFKTGKAGWRASDRRTGKIEAELRTRRMRRVRFIVKVR